MNLRKLASLLLALAMLLASCALADFANSTVLPYEGEDTGYTISIWEVITNSNTYKYISSYAENTAWAERARRCGVTLEWKHPAIGSEQADFTLMMAGGELPDLVSRVDQYYPGGVLAALDDGIFLDVTDMLEEKCPNLWSLFEGNPDYKRECFSDDGTFLGFTGVTSDWKDGKLVVIQGYPSEGPVIREDMVEGVGMTDPKTIDEWYEVLTAIKEAYEPKVVLNFNDDDHVFVGAYNIGPGFCLDDEGKAAYGPYTDAYLDYLTEMHKWFDEGLIDPEYVTRDSDAMTALINNGDVAASAFRNTAFHTEQASVYNRVWNATVYPSSVEGEEAKWRVSRALNTGCATMINANLANDPDKLDVVLKLLDFGYSEEGAYLMNCGIYGQDYLSVQPNGRVDYIEKYTENGNKMYSQMKEVFRSNAGSYLKPAPTLFNPAYFVEGTVEIIQLRLGNTDNVLPQVTLTTEESTRKSELMTDITNYVNEMEDKFIMGIVSLDEYDSYIAKLEEMGIEEVIAIYQAACDRYYAR